jgi:mannosyltransferase
VTTTAAATPEAATPEGQIPEVKARASLVVPAVAVVIAIGVVLRFVTKSDLWLDEALSVNIAHLPVSQIPSWLRHDGAPPLYYVLLHYWMAAFGTSDLAVRSLSGVASVASLPLAWYCGRRIGGRTTAWVAVLVLVSNPYAVVYATSSRMYAIEMFLVFAGILAVRRAFERPTLPRVALVALTAAALPFSTRQSTRARRGVNRSCRRRRSV